MKQNNYTRLILTDCKNLALIAFYVVTFRKHVTEIFGQFPVYETLFIQICAKINVRFQTCMYIETNRDKHEI